LAEHDAMAVRGGHEHLAKTPWPVGRRCHDDRAVIGKLRVQGFDVVDLEIGDVAVIADLAGGMAFGQRPIIRLTVPRDSSRQSVASPQPTVKPSASRK
jgi:hypothetical protein